MPAHLRFKCAWKFRDDNPKNLAVINPAFRVQWDPTGLPGDPDTQTLVDDLWAILDAFQGGTTQLSVTAYRIGTPPPNYPLATKASPTTGAIASPACPPELAVCLSFFAVNNRPRHRGRLYLPAWAAGVTNTQAGLVVPPSTRTKVGGLVDSFGSLGGVNVDFGVWSDRDNAFRKATNWFVSDAWAVQRRRGIKETARTTGTTSG